MAESIAFIWSSQGNSQVASPRQPGPSAPSKPTGPHLLQVDGSPEPEAPDPPPSAEAGMSVQMWCKDFREAQDLEGPKVPGDPTGPAGRPSPASPRPRRAGPAGPGAPPA